RPPGGFSLVPPLFLPGRRLKFSCHCCCGAIMSESVQDRLLKSPYAQKAAAGVKRHRRWLYALAGLFILFGLLGYLWLPGFAKSKAETLLSEKLHRPVTIQRIEVHPYTLEAAVEGLRIGEREGEGEL